jgi:hypothetical protein
LGGGLADAVLDRTNQDHTTKEGLAQLATPPPLRGTLRFSYFHGDFLKNLYEFRNLELQIDLKLHVAMMLQVTFM